MDFPRLSTYLAGLAANNDRAWFEANRAEFQALRDDFHSFVGEVIAGVAGWDDSVRWVDPKDCVYRIYRDVRFSNDKTPYKTTFSAVIGERGRRGHGPSYYFQVDRNGTLMAGGATRLQTWLLEADRVSAVFYESAGWAPDGWARTLDTGAEPLREIRWHALLDDDLEGLA